MGAGGASSGGGQREREGERRLLAFWVVASVPCVIVYSGWLLGYPGLVVGGEYVLPQRVEVLTAILRRITI